MRKRATEPVSHGFHTKSDSASLLPDPSPRCRTQATHLCQCQFIMEPRPFFAGNLIGRTWRKPATDESSTRLCLTYLSDTLRKLRNELRPNSLVEIGFEDF